MDDIRISLDQEITPEGLKITVKLLNCSSQFITCQEMDSDCIVISNDTLLAIAGKLE